MTAAQDKYGRLWFAVYNQHFDRDKGLDMGRFSLNWIKPDGTGATHFLTLATQATAAKQQANDFNNKGGMMPPQYRIPSFGKDHTWYIETDLKQRSLLGGDCFQVFPVYVTSETGVQRGEFFLHRNLNGVGSLGCTVFDADRLKSVVREMKNLQEIGVDRLPYFVYYS
jgi:hypothetical protein